MALAARCERRCRVEAGAAARREAARRLVWAASPLDGVPGTAACGTPRPRAETAAAGRGGRAPAPACSACCPHRALPRKAAPLFTTHCCELAHTWARIRSLRLSSWCSLTPPPPPPSLAFYRISRYQGNKACQGTYIFCMEVSLTL